MANGQKEMIHSIAQVHTSKTSDLDDVIKGKGSGKGNGMVFLFHGILDVSKTLTAGIYHRLVCSMIILMFLQRAWLTLPENSSTL